MLIYVLYIPSLPEYGTQIEGVGSTTIQSLHKKNTEFHED